jgi:peptidoglycan-associated lipoprotein
MKKSILYSAMLALAVVVMATTGCRHHPQGRVTPLPGEQNPNVAEMNTQPVTMGSDTGVTTGQTPQIAENGAFNPDNWNQDRNALAANTVHFAFDSAVIRDSDQANLQAVAQALQSDVSANLLIEGNCDERGTEEYNRSLGERRADAAREALAGMNLDPNRIHTISYGKDKPVDPGHDAAAWTKNRNDTFVVLHRKTGA